MAAHSAMALPHARADHGVPDPRSLARVPGERRTEDPATTETELTTRRNRPADPDRDRADVDALILRIAGRQHGVVERSQLRASGASDRQIDYRLGHGLLTRVHRGVYLFEPLAGRRRREFAGVLACGQESFVSHRSAAAVAGIIPSLGPTESVAISTRRDVRIRGEGIRVRRVGRLDEEEVTATAEGLPITTPARTLIDLAGVSGDLELEGAVASALRSRLVERPALADLLGRYPRHPGRGRIRTLLEADREPLFLRSEAERRLLQRIRGAGLPEPDANVVVNGFEVDFFWPHERLIVEVDGRRFHSGDHAFERDRDRDATLVAAGYRTMRVTWRQITARSPRLLVRIGQALVR